jgi:hypothetical protein
VLSTFYTQSLHSPLKKGIMQLQMILKKKLKKKERNKERKKERKKEIKKERKKERKKESLFIFFSSYSVLQSYNNRHIELCQ